MASLPYSPQPSAIPKFLKHIQGAGVPTKVTQAYLASVGFRSSNVGEHEECREIATNSAEAIEVRRA